MGVFQFAAHRAAPGRTDVGFRCWRRATRRTSTTIADFRKLHLLALPLAGLFEEVLKIDAGSGKALKLGRVALDGTKLKANASKQQSDRAMAG